jgi:hypothetical protein
MSRPLRPLLVGGFAGEAEMRAALREARDRGLPVYDAFAPYALHGIEEALGTRRSRLGWVTLAGALAGMTGAIALQVWAAVVDWPVDVGGKPANSALAFLPITFESTILLGALATAGAFFWRSRLGPQARPVLPLAGATDDRLFLVLDLDGAAEREGEMRALLAAAGAVEIRKEVL